MGSPAKNMWCKALERLNFANAALRQGVRQGLRDTWFGPQQLQRSLKTISCYEACIVIIHFSSSLYA
jgi:hypothetical protein